jgi:hypothetical protein
VDPEKTNGPKDPYQMEDFSKDANFPLPEIARGLNSIEISKFKVSPKIIEILRKYGKILKIPQKISAYY